MHRIKFGPDGDALPSAFLGAAPDSGGASSWDALAHSYRDDATGVTCFVYGYVVGYPSRNGPKNSELAEAVCRRYRTQGPDAAFNWNGVYAIFLFDPERPSWFLATDKIGLYPIFCARERNHLVASSSLAQLLPDFGLELDPAGVEEYLAVGYPLGDRTMFKGISRVEPATFLRLDAKGTVSAHRYWRFEELDAPATEKGSKVLDRHNECFREVIESHAAEVDDPIVFLSSGYDSRRIYLELRAQGVTPDTYTVRLPAKKLQSLATLEGKVVAALGAGVDAKHHELPYAQVSEFVELIERREQLLAHQCDGHEWILPLVEQVPRGGCTNFDGLGGDTICTAELAICKDEDLYRYADTEYFVKMFSNVRFAKYLSESWFESTSADLSERMREFVEQISPNPNRLPWLELISRARRSTALSGLELLRTRASVRYPYLDDRIVADCVRMDGGWRQAGTLQKYALDAAYPQYAHIPSSHTPAAELDSAYVEPMDATNDLPVAGARRGIPRTSAAALLHAAQLRHRSNILNLRGRTLLAVGRRVIRLGLGSLGTSAADRLWAFPTLAKLNRLAAEARDRRDAATAPPRDRSSRGRPDRTPPS